ncbi:MAG: HAD hydrolase-like protein [Eubacteriales bacterium]|nr:HAD hydrolase-like protein [Eubacteriales bacterium]MDD4389792.1 HAD hydrolase-like protein [Eubacteriales bacterium]
MRYKCLILDHDDTAVKSTPELHYPAFCEIMERLRPRHEGYSLDSFIRLCFDPGFEQFCRRELGFTDKEMQMEYEIWKAYIQDKTPAFYDGFLDMVREFQQRGGYISVISLSENTEIERHYRENGIKPDLVYGWEYPEEQRKPNPYPMIQTLESLKLKPADCLMVDDLKLGYDMAKACGVDFAAAGWSHSLIPGIIDFMKANSNYYFDSVYELSRFVFSRE